MGLIELFIRCMFLFVHIILGALGTIQLTELMSTASTGSFILGLNNILLILLSIFIHIKFFYKTIKNSKS